MSYWKFIVLHFNQLQENNLTKLGKEFAKQFLKKSMQTTKNLLTLKLKNDTKPLSEYEPLKRNNSIQGWHVKLEGDITCTILFLVDGTSA